MDSKDHPSNLDDEPEKTVYGYDHTNYSTTTSEDFKKEDESFEFFSQEYWLKNKDLNFSPHKDTIFGGNCILPKNPISRNTQEFKKIDHGWSKVDQDFGSCRKSEFAKMMSMNKGRTTRSHGGKNETKRAFPESASMKSRWYYYGFGLAGIPVEMDMSTIKNRQNRHRKSHSAGGENGGFQPEKRLGRLIRELSCYGQTQANPMVKASLVCIPRV